MNNFTVYSKDGCPYCQQIVQVLGLSELQYVEYKLERDFTREAFYGQFGEGATFPQVQIDTQHIGGCKETLQYLQKKKLI